MTYSYRKTFNVLNRTNQTLQIPSIKFSNYKLFRFIQKISVEYIIFIQNKKRLYKIKVQSKTDNTF